MTRLAEDLTDTCVAHPDTAVRVFAHQNQEKPWRELAISRSGHTFSHYVDGRLVGQTEQATECATFDIMTLGNSGDGARPWGALANLQLRPGSLIATTAGDRLVFETNFSHDDPSALASLSVANGQLSILGRAIGHDGSQSACSRCDLGTRGTEPRFSPGNTVL